MIGSVYLWENGMLMVMAMDGQQLERYQGPLSTERLDRLRREAPGGAVFYHGVWGGSVMPIARAVWFALAEERLHQAETEAPVGELAAAP